MSRPVTWITDAKCTECGQAGAMESPYTLCPRCWATANYRTVEGLRVLHVREREKFAANRKGE